MRDSADRSPALRRPGRTGELASYGMIALAVVLGWQIAIQPLIQRAPVAAAIRLAPASPLVLRRAAESELTAGRVDNAAALGRDALARAPFNVQALRVVGLTEARAGRTEPADNILTLAGNWSLRDDPAHAWLIEHRLRRGDYTSSFAHADTLVRRREDLYPQVFRLFTVAGTEDPERSLPVIARLLSAKPPWRGAFLGSLTKGPEELQLAARLAILLETGSAPLAKDELEQLYWALLTSHQFQMLETVRERLDRPAQGVSVTNGSLADPAAPEPFQWRIIEQAGVIAEIVPDDLDASNRALRVGYDGYAGGTITEQLTSLRPGSYRFSARVRAESGDPRGQLAWSITCVSGQTITSVPVDLPEAPRDAWTTLSREFAIPADCPIQWLRLDTRADDRRSGIAVWFDSISISPATARAGG